MGNSSTQTLQSLTGDIDFLKTKLTPRRRAIILLWLKHDFSYEALSKAFRIDLETARSHTKQILQLWVDYRMALLQKMEGEQ
ncbi:MAG: hypothetical protein AABZ60_14905 [Planctomycetota bacterium]